MHGSYIIGSAIVFSGDSADIDRERALSFTARDASEVLVLVSGAEPGPRA